MLKGKAEFDFRVYRESADSSVTAYLQDSNDGRNDVGIKINPGTGRLSFSQGGKWTMSDVTVPVQQWSKIKIALDLGALTYSAYLSSAQDQVVCQNIAYPLPKP